MSMSEDFFTDEARTAQMANYSAMDENADEAARALELSQATGVPSTAIYGDIDGFERQHKAALGSSIIGDNFHIADYLNSHPMAARVSHDDLGQLDVASQHLSRLGDQSGLEGWLKSDSIARSFMQGFGEQPLAPEGYQRFYKGYSDRPSEMEWALKHPGTASLLSPVTRALGLGEIGAESLSRVTSGFLQLGEDGITKVFGAGVAREARAMAEWAMMRGDVGVHPQGGPGDLLNKNADLLAKMKSGLDIADKYPSGEPPLGVHPIIDDVKTQQAKVDGDAFKQALAEGNKSATRDRSPELYAQFVRSHVGDREIGIDADAIRKLYGDKVPTADDGILGFVPGLRQSLEAAEGYGGDVQIPLADYLAHIEPEVAKELHDFTRLRDGGLTLDETKLSGLGERSAIADPVQLVRGSGGMEPMFQIGDRKLTLEAKGPDIDAKTGVIGSDQFRILDETGKKVGFLEATAREGGTKVYIDNIGGLEAQGFGPNSFGPGLTRSLLAQIKSAYPNVKEIGGFRISGARERAGRTGPATIKVQSGDAFDAITHEHFRNLLSQNWEDLHAGVSALFESEGKGLASDTPMGRIVLNELRRIVPDAGRDVAHDISVDGVGNPRGVFFPNLRQIVVSLNNRDPIGSARHESIHALKKMGMFSDAEWSTLEKASQRDWVKRYSVAERWGKYEGANFTEEGIAEAYQHWANGGAFDKAHATLFQRIKDFFEGLRQRFGEMLGHDLSWEKIFEKIDSGEIGSREPKAELAKPSFNRFAAQQDDNVTNFRRAANQNQQLTGREARKQKSDLAFRELQDFQKELDEKIAARKAKEDEGDPKFQPDDKPPAREVAPGIPEREGIFAEAKALGVTQAHMDRMLRLIEKRNNEDLSAATARAERQHKRTMTKEWKDRRTEIRDEVREQFAGRPDLATDELFAKGDIKLHPDALTPEQRSILPKEYVQKAKGVSPDDLAPHFGYTSGDALVERLGMLTQDRRVAGMSQRDYLNRLIDVETDRRVNAEFGDLGQKIMEEAKDQAVSETQLNLVHEETLAYALAAGEEPQFTKEQTRAMVKGVFDQTPVGQIKFDRIVQTAGKLGRKIEDAASRGDWAEAYRLSQQRNHATIAAKLAREYERERTQLNRTAKTFAKREVPSVEGEYRNHIQDVLRRIGYKGARSVQNIQENIGRQAETTLEQFLQAKLTESMGLRDMPLADVLQDPQFRKPVDQLPYADFKEVKGTIDALVENGRGERKVYREGEAFDRKQILGEMKDQVKTFREKAVPAGYEPGLAKQYIAGSTSIPTLMNRFDRADARGLFHKFVTYPLSRAANSEAKLSREISTAYRALGDWGDMKKKMDPPPLDPEIFRYSTFTRENVLAMLQNAGNRSNWNVLAKGWGADPEALMQWLHRNTTKADWDRAQKFGDTIWNDLIKRADNVYERLNGQTVDKIPLEPIDTPFGTYRGWYHKLIPDPIWLSEKMKMRGGPYKDGDFGHILTSNGYTKSRTGAVYPVDLSFRMIPKHLDQMIHDINFREPLLETQKILMDPSLQNTITQHYGKHYAQLLQPYLEDLAGKQSINGAVWAKLGQASEILRQNTISTYIGANLYTVLKHAPTAFFMSMRDVGPVAMAQSYGKLFGQSPEVGKTWWKFALDASEELQRRERNWRETLGGALSEQYGYPSMREKVMQWGAWPVAMSDKLSAVPLWVARFERSLGEGSSFGEAVDIADRSVRSQHGSTATTNQPALVRGGGPLHGWLTSVYGFFGTVMQRRIEIMHTMNDTFQLGKRGEIASAAKLLPGLSADILTYYVIPTAIEEWVTGLNQDDRRGLGERVLLGGLKGAGSSFLYLRDLIDAFTSGHTPGAGLLTSAEGDLDKAVRDVMKGKVALNREHAGKTVQDFLTFAGEASGMMPKAVANAARFGIDYANRQDRPKGPGELLRGVTRGTTKLRVEK